MVGLHPAREAHAVRRGRWADPVALEEWRRALAAGRDPARVAGDRVVGRLTVNDDPYRMYIVIRRGAFSTLDEGGRMVGLAAVRAVRQFELPEEWLRRAGKVVLR